MLLNTIDDDIDDELDDKLDHKLLVGFMLQSVEDEAFLALNEADADADASDEVLPVVPCVWYSTYQGRPRSTRSVVRSPRGGRRHQKRSWAFTSLLVARRRQCH